MVDGQSFELPDYLVGVVGSDRRGNKYPSLPPGWRRVTQNQFSHMVLARYPAASSTQLISEEWVNNAVSRWCTHVAKHGEIPLRGINGIFGVDVGEYGSDPSVLCMRYGGWVAPMQQWYHTDVLTTGDMVADAYVTYNGFRVNVDATGVGAGVSPQIRRCFRAKKIALPHGRRGGGQGGGESHEEAGDGRVRPDARPAVVVGAGVAAGRSGGHAAAGRGVARGTAGAALLL